MIASRLLLVAVLTIVLPLPGHAADAEMFCAKPETTAWDDNTTIACYSDAGCAYAEKLGAYVARNYDLKSVVPALGREKIEGIVTSSPSILKSVQGFGYACVSLDK